MKRLLKISMILTMCMTVVFAFTVSVNAASVQKVSNAKQFSNIGKSNGGTYKLTKDIKLSRKNYLTISKNKTYTINLNGHKITANPGKTSQSYNGPITIMNGTLKLTNSVKKTGRIRSYEYEGITMTGGKLYTNARVEIYCEHASGNGTGIQMYDNSTLYAKAGDIWGRTTGVSMFGGKLYTYGAGTKTFPTIVGHDKNGLSVMGSNTQLVLKGGIFGTMSEKQFCYPISDMSKSQTPLISSDYEFLDKDLKHVDVTTESSGSRYVNGTVDTTGLNWVAIFSAD